MATNAFAAFVQGRQAGQQARAFEQQQQDRNALRTLAPQILAGDPAAFDQAAAINPEAAVAYQDAGDTQLRRLKGALDYFGQGLQSGDDRLIQARFKEISPFMSRITGKEAPPAWTADMMPAFEQAKTRVAMLTNPAAASGVQSTYVDDQGNRIAIMRDGSTQLLGRNNASIRVLEPEGAVPYGVVTSGGRAGQMVGIGAGIPAQVPEPAAASASPAQGAAPLMVMDPVNGGLAGPPRTPTAAEKAGASERARLEAQMDYLPAELAMRSRAAVDQAVGIEQGKSAAEKAAAAPGTIATLQGSVDSIDQLLNSRELGSIVGLGSLNPLNRVPGTDARGLIARADQIAGQAFLAAFNQLKGGGAITEREGAAATAAMARLDRSQSEADYRRALTDLRDAITPAIARARQQAGAAAPAASGPTPGTVEDGYRFRGGNPAEPGNWERL